MTQTTALRKTAPLLMAFFVICVLGLYFRTYALRPSTDKASLPKAAAEEIVLQGLKGQLRQVVESQYPEMEPELVQKIIDERANQLKMQNPADFQVAMDGLASRFESEVNVPESRNYLLGADSYYYLYLTENVLEEGSISQDIRGGKFFNPHRLAPNGVWSLVNWHPYIGLATHKILGLFGSKNDLMASVAYTPLILMLLIALVALRLFIQLRFSWLAVCVGCFTLLMSPIAIQRGAYAWYDTDPYNYLFPLLILSCFFAGIQSKAKGKLFGVAAGLLTGLYAMFWVGWPWIFLMICGLCFVGFVLKQWLKKSGYESSVESFSLTYLGGAVLMLIVVMSPAGFYKSVKDVLTYLPQFAGLEYNPWPNIFITVGETRSISLSKLMFVSGNPVTFAFALVGVIAEGVRAIQLKDSARISRWGLLTAFMLPLLVMALRTERFTLLFVIPLALTATMGAEVVFEYLKRCLDKVRQLSVRKYATIIAGVVVITLLLPLQLVFAHAVAKGLNPIMNDAWYGSLQKIKEESPDESVVYSWWPPGHFITSIARRSVAVDGASQHLPECYWIARFFMAQSEAEAVGILRMLNLSGNKAVDYLLESDLGLVDAIELLDQIFILDGQEALVLLESEVGNEIADELIKLTHHDEGVSPARVFLYDEMVEKTLAMSFMAGWNFEKAMNEHEMRKYGYDQKVETKQDFVKNVVSMSEGMMSYTPESNLTKQSGENLKFANGLSVNLEAMDARIQIPAKGVQGKPFSLFYMKNGLLREKRSSKDLLTVSALLIEKEGVYTSVLADRRLIKSVLFRLYYLNGEGLKHFKSWFENFDAKRKNRFQGYEVLWNVV